MICFEMLRGGEKVADVVAFANGRTVVTWPTSTIVYDSFENACAVHIKHMGGRGEKTEFREVGGSPAATTGSMECTMDAMENVPFASIGGEGNRGSPEVKAPSSEQFLLGYTARAALSYGPDWRTVSFGWAAALTINESKS